MAARFARAARVGVLLAIVLTAGAASAEPIQVAGSVEPGAAVPTSSTKQLHVSLQLLVPLVRAAGTKLLAGLGPRAMTQELLTSNLPEVVALGAGGSFRVEF